MLREDHDADKLKESAARDIIEIARQSGDSAASDLTEADVRLSVVKINYGKKEKNPIDSVSFYHSLQDTEASALGPEHVSLLIPKASPKHASPMTPKQSPLLGGSRVLFTCDADQRMRLN